MYLFFYFTNTDIVACSSVIYHLQLVNLQQTTPLASRIMIKTTCDTQYLQILLQIEINIGESL